MAFFFEQKRLYSYKVGESMQNYNVGYNTTIPSMNPAQQVSGQTTAIPNTNGVNIIIYNPSVNPNGANFNNTYNTMPNNSGQPGQAYPQNYYINNMGTAAGAQPIAANSLQGSTNKTEGKEKPKKEIVQLTDEYIKTLENYLRNPNPDVKLMGAKELMKRFREDDSRKNDAALTSLLNLTLQSKYSPVRMIGMGIISNGWASGDILTQQLLAAIQQTNGAYGLDALDAAEAALKSAGKTIKVPDNNPEHSKEKKTESK